MKFFRNIFALCFFAVNASSCSHYFGKKQQPNHEGQWGRLKRFQDLSKYHSAEDYRIAINYGDNTPLVMAIHGGKIEAGTSELARAINDELKLSSYIFEGLKAPDFFNDTIQSGHMHITSHRFDDPKLIELAQDSPFCLSLHGFPNPKTNICLGGLAKNKQKAALMNRLERAFPSLDICIDCCPPYLGKHPRNVVNLCKSAGIQLEMNPEVRSMILKNSEFKEALASELRGFLSSTGR